MIEELSLQFDNQHLVRLTDIFDAVLGSGAPGDLARPPVQLLSPAVLTDPHVIRPGEPDDHTVVAAPRLMP